MGWKGALVEPLVWYAGVAFGSVAPPAEVAAPRDILVLRPNDLGDLLTATPIFDALHRKFPAARIIAGVGSWGRPVVAHNPYIDEVVELDVPWNNKFVPDQSWRAAARFLISSPQISALRQRGGFDVGIDLLGSHLGALLMLRLGVRFRVGIRGYRGGWSACQKYTRFSNVVHVSQAALDQVSLLGATDLPEARPQLFLTADERAEASALWSANEKRPNFRLLVGVGGGLPEKCFPSDALGRVLARLTSIAPHQGPQLNVLLTGGPADISRSKTILSSCNSSVRSVCGITSLRITLALAEQADLVLTNPSMLLHAAAAFRRPTLAILGGLYADATAHDRLWGYPPPYQSVAPHTGELWPIADEVLASLLKIILQR